MGGNRTVLAFLAHPDDAEIFCGGTLIRLARLGWKVHIATCTAGDCGTTTVTPQEISAIRTREARDAAASIGATYHCMGDLDALVVYDKPTLQKAYDLFRRVAPSLVFIHHPLDYMMDHVQASYVGRAAAFIYGAPNISAFPLLPGSTIPHLYYCDTMEGKDPFGKPVQPSTFVDISSVIEDKAKMLAVHASQREWLRAHHGMDEYLEAMRRQGQMRGRSIGKAYAEAFVQHLGHAYPQDDLLEQLFS